tara:strand:- start:810 stop:1013 length:204 start_codon:yes stop_codon:yes gene_type:complete
MATVKLTAQQKRDRDYMTQTAELLALQEAELMRTNNEHYSLGINEAWNDAGAHYKSLSLLDRLLGKW